jgi:hypothetical protein
MGAPMSPQAMQSPPAGPAGFAPGATTGSGLSHSQVTPYPSVADLEGYEGEGSLKPGRRGLYIGVALATIGLVIAIVIGRSGEGPRSTNAGSGPSGPTLPDDKTAGTTPETSTPTATPAPAPTPAPTPAPAPAPIAQTTPATTPPVPPPPPPPAPATTTATTPPVPATTPAPTQPPEPPKPTTIKVVIKSEPTGAEVLANGKKVGTTPFTTTLPIDAASTPYTLRHDGYADEVVTIKHAKDYDAITHLAKKPEPTKTTPKTTTSSGSKSNKSGGGKSGGSGTKSGGGTTTTTSTSSGTKTTTPKEPCQKRGGPIQPFGPKLPLCPE